MSTAGPASPAAGAAPLPAATAAGSGRLGGMGLLLVTAFAWGLNWPVMKLLMEDWPPFAFRVLAGAGTIALLAAVAAAQGDALWPRPGVWGRLAVAAVLNVTSWSGLAPLSLFWLDASEAAIIAYTMPVWATVLAWPVLGERPTWRRLAGLALGLSGVALLVGGPLASSAPAAAAWAKWPGVAAILATALMFASGTVFAKRAPVAMAPVPLVAWQLAIGLLPVAAVAAAFEPAPDLAHVTWVGWGCLAYVAVLAQGVAYLAWFRALRRLPTGTAAIGSLLIPVIGVFGSALALGEPLGARQVAALGLTLGGVALAARG